MWEATAVVVLAALVAAVVAAVLLRAHAPEQGYRAWVLEAFRAARTTGREDLQGHWWTEAPDTEDVEVADLFAVSEPGAGYEVAPDLREVVRRQRGRD